MYNLTFRWASYRGDCELFLKTINCDRNIHANVVFQDGNTPMHYCAFYNNKQLCILLCKLKVQQTKNFLNWKPLHIAAYLNNSEIVNILCKQLK